MAAVPNDRIGNGLLYGAKFPLKLLLALRVNEINSRALALMQRLIHNDTFFMVSSLLFGKIYSLAEAYWYLYPCIRC